MHDLTHYAVETTLAYRRGFFGLIFEGWNVEDTTGKGMRGSLPAEALEVEHMVGLFDRERGTGLLWTVEEFNEIAPRPITQADLEQIRATRARLFQEWFGTPTGDKLALEFSVR